MTTEPGLTFEQLSGIEPLPMNKTERVVVLVIRDPDDANDITVYGVKNPLVYDVDLGYMDLDDDIEFREWASSEYINLECLPEGHPAREVVRRIILQQGQRHGLETHEAIRAHLDSEG